MNYKNLEFILRPHTIDQYFKRVIQVRPLQLQRQSEDIKLSIFSVPVIQEKDTRW